MSQRTTLSWIGLCIMLRGLSLSTQGVVITAEQARQAAIQWIRISPAFDFASRAENAQPAGIKSIQPILFSGKTPQAWHVALDPAGYVVLAADNRLLPVIAFSITANLDLSPVEENSLRFMLERDIEKDRAALAALDATAIAAPAEPPPEIGRNLAYWNLLLSPGDTPPAIPTALATNVAPLIKTAWNQTRYFNDLMPACASSGTGYNGRMPAGCGSIAGAQLLNYYRWPYRGTGQQGYYDDSTYRTNSLYRIYDWASLLNTYVYTGTYPASNTAAIATLVRDVGYASETDYECTLSGSYNQSFADAANRFFFYTQTESMPFNQARVQSELTARRPVHVSYDESGGHILVADGLAMDGATAYLHINYGWGGAQDGWYRPTSLYGSASLDFMTPGVEPLLMPMMTNAQNTMASRNFSVGWAFPAWHTNSLQSFDLLEGAPGATTTFTDSASHFSNWWNQASGWRIASGQFFYCATNPHQGFIQLARPLVPGSGSTMTYTYRRSLAAVNNVFIEVSADLGQSWAPVALFTGQVYDSTPRSGSIGLGAYSGLPIYLRVRFCHSRGIWGWYGASKETAGFYLDDIAVSNCRRLDWSPVATQLAKTVRSHAITDKFGGAYYHIVIARATNGVEYVAPFVSQTTVNFESFALRAVALTNNTILRWSDPVACGYLTNRTHVRVSTATYPTGLTDGAALYTGTNRLFDHTGLVSGQPYYYTIWCSDDGVTFVEP